MIMYTQSVTILNPTGIHARPASDLVNYCKQFPDTAIHLLKGEKQLNAKSIISVLSGGLKQGLEIVVRTEGAEEEDVCRKVVAFIQALE